MKLLNSTNQVNTTKLKLTFITSKFVVINIEIHVNKWIYEYKTA